jgi:acetylornithine/N-succinyldiaminopimelate aminotransferase
MIANAVPTLMPCYNRLPVAFDRGEGSYIYDEAGRAYLDFAGGIAVTALGHCHPHLVDALKTQAEKLWHTSNMYAISEQQRLADRLVEATALDSVFFTNSGVEAIECSIKLARRYQFETGQPQRYRIITYKNAFHGRSLATIAAAGQEKLTKGFGPMMEAFDSVPFLDLIATKAAITDETAAIMIEPVQGEGGIRPASAEDLQGLRKIADEAGILLIFDEIQCGMGRTGKLFAYEWAGIAPDILASAKAIGGGFPIGACLAKAHVAVHLTAGAHGTTYGGNPMAMAVGNAVLDVMLEDGFMEGVQKNADILRRGLDALQDKYADLILDVRGSGMMLGMELSSLARPFVEALLADGFLAAQSGTHVLRLLPPLNISEAEITLALDYLDNVFARFSQ